MRGVEAVHLDEQLVERLLALVVAAAEAGAAVAADGVDLVDEDDRRARPAWPARTGRARGWRRRRRTSRRSRSRRSRRTARRPRRPRPGPAASCRCRAGRRAARPWGSWRRWPGTGPGSARKSLISWSSSTASSQPATSAKVTFGSSLDTCRALALPNCITRLPPPCIELRKNRKSAEQHDHRQEAEQQRRPDGVLLLVDLELDRRLGVAELAWSARRRTPAGRRP